MNYIEGLGQKAQKAKKSLATASTGQKNEILTRIAAKLLENQEQILAENEKDIANARENGISETMVDRLRLTPERIQGISDACIQLTNLEDPVGEIIEGSTRPNGMKISKIRVPMGVVGIIYESRPNVTVDAASLCIKSGNAAILRGGKEAICSNKVLMNTMREAVAQCGFPEDIVQLVEDTSREVSTQMMQANGLIDVLIPRGGAGLIQAVVKNATLPVIETGTGNCHIYVDAAADLQKALDIVYNAKTSRPSVCNAAEVCLVHRDVAEAFLPALAARLAGKQVELRLCPRAAAVIPGTPAGPEDFDTEFLDYILAVKVVDSVQDAAAHIAAHSTGHSEAIVTEDAAAADAFCAAVDSAAVYVNASTRFTDGGEFGLGCEMGISTQKLGARGPMGLAELTSYKYIIRGNGQVR